MYDSHRVVRHAQFYSQVEAELREEAGFVVSTSPERVMNRVEKPRPAHLLFVSLVLPLSTSSLVV